MDREAHQKLMAVVAQIASRIERLPAVPIPDWCDRAAQTLVQLPGTESVGVWVTNEHWGSGQKAVEAVGAATDPRAADAVAWTHHVRSVLNEHEKLTGASLAPARPAEALSFAVESVASGAFHRSGCLGTVARHPLNSAVLNARAVLSHMARSRVLHIVVACDRLWIPQNADLIRAVGPLLAARATMTFGGNGITEIKWLTVREQEVLACVAMGQTSSQIAKRLCRSEMTIHDHLKSVHKKLGVSTRGALLARVHASDVLPVRGE